MKYLHLVLIIVIFLLISCNNSDFTEKMPLGYEFIFEGGNQNRLLKDNNLVIDSGLVDCKYNKYYIVVSVDTTFSDNPQKMPKSRLKYLIQNIKKDTVLNKISFSDLQKLIKRDKSLQDIDITK
ncbi:hypothetical protein [Chryseobacterium hagamense]|nr:hypothetical protein [Chryseobacterium hagamense]